MMIDPEKTTYLYKVNLHYLQQFFKATESQSKYHVYRSKDFYGAVLRSRESLMSLDGEEVVVSMRLKGRGGEGGSVNGIKIDLMKKTDPRVDKYGIDVDDLSRIDIEVHPNEAGNILLVDQLSEASAFFYKRQEGSSLIIFVRRT